MRRPLTAAETEAAFLAACEAELTALKPGNVHVYASGHRMQVSDFRKSAAAAAPHIANPRLAAGTRIRRAMAATMEAAGCNTNLGILLLSAPLAIAGQDRTGAPFRDVLSRVLDTLGTRDAAETFAAIRIANPAGLGKVPQADVKDPAGVTLKEAMRLAAGRDRIARAYVTGYSDILGFGLRTLAGARASAGGDGQDPVTALHMSFLARFPDSHIRRKHGLAIARSVRDEARALQGTWNPPIGARSRSKLLGFDQDLKARGLNPGTTADMVVATLLAETIIAAGSAASGR